MGVVERNGKEVYAYAAKMCKTWSCSFCGPRKAWRLSKRMAEVMKEQRLDRMMTLTLDPKKVGRCAGPGVAWEVWRKFRVYLRRLDGEKLSFVAVLEPQKSGMPHLHVLVSRFIAQEWISESWDAVGGGRIVDIRRVGNGEEMARYLAKYLTKSLLGGGGGRARRYSCSRNIKLAEERGPRWKRFRELKCGVELIRKNVKRGVLEESCDRDGNVTFFTTTGPVPEAWRRG